MNIEARSRFSNKHDKPHSRFKTLNNLVLSGGGMGAVAIIGALKRLIEDRHNTFTNYAGSSFGALLALMMSVHMDLAEAEQLLLNFDYNEYQSCNLSLLLTEYGIDDGVKLQRYICKLLRKHTGLNDPTLKQLHSKYNNTLWISAVEINSPDATHKDQVVYWNHNNAPDMPVALAIRSSISIPLVFTASTVKGKKYVDGCIVDNFPVSLFPPEETLGIRVTNRSHAHREHDCHTPVDYSLPPANLYQHITGIWSCVYTEMHRLRQKLYRYPHILTIPIEFGLSLTLNKPTKIKMIDDGYNAMDYMCTENKENTHTEWMNKMLDIVQDVVEFDRENIDQVARIKNMIYLLN